MKRSDTFALDATVALVAGETLAALHRLAAAVVVGERDGVVSAALASYLARLVTCNNNNDSGCCSLFEWNAMNERCWHIGLPDQHLAHSPGQWPVAASQRAPSPQWQHSRQS